MDPTSSLLHDELVLQGALGDHLSEETNETTSM